MKWVETTYWVVSHEGGLVTLQAVSVDDPMMLETIRDAEVIIVPVNEFFPCMGCPCLEQCMGSHWTDGRVGGPHSTKMSAVSICSVCQEHIFSMTGTSQPVSAKCPRQRVAGQDCRGCNLRRQSWSIN